MATQATTKEEIAKAQAKARQDALEAKQKALDADVNAKRTGKGTRRFVGMTRGKNPQMVEFEQFDTSKPETLPANPQEFVEAAKLSQPYDVAMTQLAILGYNEQAYSQASDPIAEYVDLSWSDEVQKNFRQVIRNYSQGANVSIEDAVELIRGPFVASLAKSNSPATAGV